MVIDTWGPEETRAFGKKMGQEARPGQVICLNGDLGVGKTIFTQGFAEGQRSPLKKTWKKDLTTERYGWRKNNESSWY